MKSNRINAGWLMLLALLSTVNYPLSTAHAQGSAFTYQGRLNNNGAPANGSYDFRFRLATDPYGNNYVDGPVLINGLAVNNGLFLATLDFGSVFAGSNYWLEVDVRTNGAGGYTALSPLQPVTPAPYAIMANNASNLLGTLPAAQLSAGTANISISGSAATAVNGVVTTGSYADPGWITSLAGGKITGNIGGNAANISGTLPLTQLGTGTATISISGNAATATTATSFSGSLAGDVTGTQGATAVDRKSTRLNSSHLGISYAVFCL